MTTLASTTVKLIEAPPGAYDDSTLRFWAGMPPTNDERLILTDQALVYQTDYRVLDVFKRALQAGARLWASGAARRIIDHLASYVDTDDRTLWLPWNTIRATGDALEVRFGQRPVAFYHYEVQTAAGSLYFLQVPVGHRTAARDFQRLIGILLG